MVTAFQMGIFVGNDMWELHFIRSRGNVDSRLKAAKNKRSLNVIANPNSFPQVERRSNSLSQPGYN